MKTITSEDLDYDVIDGEYLNIQSKIYLKSGEIIKNL